MAAITIYPPPVTIEDDPNDVKTPLDEHYLSIDAQQTGVKRYREGVEDTQAQESLDRLLRETRSNAKHIKVTLVSHGDVVLSRWKKYSHGKRATLPRAVSSETFKDWHQIETFRSNPASDPWEQKRGSIGCIRWLNSSSIGQLSQDRMRILSLLHVRSEYEPQQWAALDTRSARATFMMDTVHSWYNANVVVMHGESYGRLKEFVRCRRSAQLGRSWVSSRHVDLRGANPLDVLAVFDDRHAGSECRTHWQFQMECNACRRSP